MDTYKEDGVIFLACTNVYQLNEEASKKYEELMEEKSKTPENANEGISLLENISNLGVPIPNKIKTALEQLNNDEDQENE